MAAMLMLFCVAERGRAEPRARGARDQPASAGLQPGVPRHGAAPADPDDRGVASSGLHPALGQPTSHQAEEDRAEAAARSGGEPHPTQRQCPPRQPGHDGPPDLRDRPPGPPAVPHPAANPAAAATTADPGTAAPAAATDPAAAPVIPGDDSPSDPPVPGTHRPQPTTPAALTRPPPAALTSTPNQSASATAPDQSAESSQQEGGEEERKTEAAAAAAAATGPTCEGRQGGIRRGRRGVLQQPRHPLHQRLRADTQQTAQNGRGGDLWSVS